MSNQPNIANKKSFLSIKLWVFFIAINLSLFYIKSTYPHYFNFTFHAYGARYWPIYQLVFIHIMSGLTALMTGALQFLFVKCVELKKIHKTNGYIYLLCVTSGTVAALIMAFALPRHPMITLGLIVLAMLWMITTTVALISIKNGKFQQHKNWMIRSYILTFSFTTSRLIQSVLTNLHWLSPVTITIVMTWASWLIPLFLYEWRMKMRIA